MPLFTNNSRLLIRPSCSSKRVKLVGQQEINKENTKLKSDCWDSAKTYV